MADGLCHIITAISPHGNLFKIYFYLIHCNQKTEALKAFKKLDVLDNLSVFKYTSCTVTPAFSSLLFCFAVLFVYCAFAYYIKQKNS